MAATRKTDRAGEEEVEESAEIFAEVEEQPEVTPAPAPQSPASEVEHIPASRGVGGSFRIDKDGNRIPV